MRLKHYLMLFLLLVNILNAYSQTVEPFVPARYTDRIKGDILMIGNNVLSIHQSNEYNTVGNPSTANDDIDMVYVDVDGDASTFSSSSAIMQVPNTSRDCYKIVYAALYWSGTYRTGDRSQLNQVRFKTPGSSTYTNITGSIIYDEGVSDLLTNDCLPYAAFADVTSLINPTNAEGNYTVADVRASLGDNSSCPGGNSAGWNLFLVYSDPKLPGKFITTFDGFAGIQNGETLNIPVSGFQSNPAGNVNAKLAFAALEGDNKLSGDGMQIRGTTPALPVIGFSNVTAPSRTTTNFFNSSISDVSGNSSGRTPNSQNTLGFDAGITDIANPARSVLRNNETDAEVRIYTNQDKYYLYFLAFSIEIIEPEILMTKAVQNLAGQDIGNQNVTLCQELNYVIAFDNIGNDDAEGVTGQALPPGGVGLGSDYVLIRDVLPINTTLVSIDTSNVPGTIIVNSPAGTLNIYVPKTYLTSNETRHFVTIRVKIACSCAELTTACSNLIVNQAFITYQGVISDIVISNDPSSATYNLACLSGNADSTNFLVGLDTCVFNTDVIICGTNATLTAGSGYDNYVWTGPAGATFVPNNTSQTVTVNMLGTYTVNGTDAQCRPIRQIFNVIQFGAGITNPIIPYDENPTPVICTDNGERLPYIFLCGSGDSQLLQTNITDAISVQWFLYNPALAGCGPYPATNCPVTNAACWTNQVGTGTNYTVTAAGMYSVVFTFPGGCTRTFYFNVYQNLLDPQIVKEDIICGNPGSITVTNVSGSGYEYQLLNGAVVVFPWQANNIFTPINAAGTYTVQVRPTTFSGGCVFSVPNIGIQVLDVTVSAIVTQPLCFGEQGSVNIQITGVPGQYYYTLHQGTIAGPIVGSVGPTNSTFNIFSNLTPGQTYTWETHTDDGCPRTGTFTINNPSQLVVTSSITRPLTNCGDGEITVNTTGGTPPYYYYLNSAPPAPFIANGVSSVVIPVPSPGGTYTITVYDANNCIGTTQQVITATLPPVYTVSHTDILCASAPNAGTITFNVTNANGNTLMFSINGGTTWQASPVFTNLPAGSYNTMVQYTIGTAVCTSAVQVIVIDPANPLAATAAISTAYTCTSAGAITVTVTANGAGGLQYSLDGITWQASPIFTPLTAGTYTVFVRDVNGCTITIAPSLTIVPLTPPTDLSFSATPLTCPTNVSTVTVTATGGSAPLNYQITAPIVVNNGNNNVFTNLAPNTYTFLVTDAKNCTYSETFTIAPLTPFVLTPTVVSNVVCFGSSTGVIRFTVSGYAPTYNYTVTGPGGYSQSATGVSASTVTLPAGPAGSYTITVTNPVTNCQDSEVVTILGPSAALTANVVTTPVTCAGLGTITVNASGGWGGYVYTIAPPAGNLSGNVFSNVPAGSYVITTTDANGCQVTNNVTFTAPTMPILTLSSSPASDFCFDSGNQATLVVTASNGVAPYSFSINGGAYVLSNTPVNSHTFSNLVPGSYIISVRDAYGCTNSVVFSQTINPQLTANIVLTKDFDCTASSGATIIGNIFNGYPAYQEYLVSYNGGAYVSLGAPTGSTFTYTVPTTNPGTYQFQVRDLRGCIAYTNIITISPLSLPVLTVTPATQMLSCYGDSTGVINVSIAGGNPTFTVTVVNTTTGVNYGTQTTGLPAGNYTITVVDSKSCSDTENVVINQPLQLTFTPAISPITCNPVGGYTLGQICANAVSGGTPPFTYTLVDLTGGTPNQVFGPTAATSHCFTGVDFGIYDIFVTDANGCTHVVSNQVMSNPPSDLTFVVNPTIPSCAAGATIDVTLVGAIGAGPFQFGIVNLTAFPWSSSFVNASNPPFQHQFTGLTPGTFYTIVVRDMTTGCYYFEPVNSPTPTNSTLNPTYTPNNVTCRGANDGSITITGISGIHPSTTSIQYTINYSPSNVPISMPVPHGTIVLPAVFPITIGGALTPGTYNIHFTEIGGPAISGCGITTAPFVISQSATILSLTASATNDNCNVNAGVITAVASGGTAPYTYQYLACGSPAPLASSVLWGPSNIANVESGCYDVYVKDANGCIRTVPVTVLLDPTPAITATIVNACVAQGTYQITVNLSSPGVAPYMLSINNGAYQLVTFPYTISGLSSGVYSFEVIDRNGCGNNGTPISVTILAPLSASATFTTQPTCNTTSGTITAVATGGSGNYTYTLGATTNATGVFTGMAPGTYTINILDTTTTCTTTATVTLAAAIVPSFTLAQTPVLCAGDSNGSITVTLLAGNTDVPYTYEIIAGPVIVPAQPSNVFSNLPAGNYTVQVNSGRGCINTTSIIVGTPLALTGTATLPNPLYTCTNNVVNTIAVQINVTPGTGTAPYTYSINGVNFFSTNVFNIAGSTTGPVTVNYQIKDNNGCIFNGNIVIPQIVLISATVTQTQQINCINTGEIVTINAVGGSGTYSYVSLPQPGGAPNVVAGPGANQFTITAPGTYYFSVIDTVTGCHFDTTAYLVPVFNTIDVVATATKPVTCFGGTDGELTFSVSGYTGPFTYDVLNSSNVSVFNGAGNAPAANVLVTGLAAGSYTIQVVETANPRCTEVSNSVTILSPSAALTISASEVANVTCDNNRGIIVATATGGWTTTPYTYTLNPGAVTNTTGVFTGLSGTTVYTITVTDALGCTVPASVTLTRPTQITANPIANVQLTCFGVNNGTITVTGVTGGQNSPTDYVYTLTYPDGSVSGPQASPTFNNLSPGNYSVVVNDPYNCLSAPIPFTVLPANQIVASLSKVPNSQVCDTSQEQLVLSASGGTGIFFYSLSPTGPWTPLVPNPLNLGLLPAGTHTYYVIDSNNCTAVVSNTVVIDTLNPLTLVILPITDTTLDCSYDLGSIYAEASGGEGAYTYTLLPGGATNTTGIFNGLGVGNYTVQVTSGDCTMVQAPVTITAPLELLVTAVAHNTKCSYSNDGDIVITLTGVDGRQIQYELISSDGVYTGSQSFDIPDPSVPFTIPNLGPGTYTLNVHTVPSNCGPGIITPLVITRPAPITFTSTIMNHETCFGDNDGEIIVDAITGGTTTDALGNPIPNPYQITLNYVVDNSTTPPTDNSVYVPLNDLAGAGTHVFSNLAAGSYYINVTDGNGCDFPQRVSINPGDNYNPEILVTYPCNPLTNEPMVRIEVINTIAPNTFGPLYEFQLDGFPRQSSPIFESTNATYTAALLAPGTHTHSVGVFSPTGCDKLALPNPFSVTPREAVTVVLSEGGLNTALATATGGSGNYTYTFYANGQEEQSGTSNTYVYFEQYNSIRVVVTDSEGCYDDDTKTLPYYPIFIPNVFTPNGNNTNEMWGPTNTANYKNLKTKIYDRYGRLVAELAEGQFWDGKYSGNELPSGDYWYVIKVDGNNDREFVGHFTLYR